MDQPHSLYSTWSPKGESGLRGKVRHLALDFLSTINSTGSKPHRSQPHVQFLYIHHVFADEEKALRQLLTSLSEDYTFLSHSDAVNRVREGNIDRPYLSFSSDDGFLNNLRAADIFQEFDISACFFLNPNTIGLTDQEAIAQFCRSRLNARPVEFLDWDQVERIQKQGHEIGSHSLAHLNLAALSATDVKEDLEQSKAALEEHCGTIEHFAFPYGRWSDFSTTAFQACLEVGHTSCATAERGCHVNDTPLDLSRHLLFRDQVILGWPERHIRYFIGRNLRRSPASTNALAP